MNAKRTVGAILAAMVGISAATPRSALAQQMRGAPVRAPRTLPSAWNPGGAYSRPGFRPGVLGGSVFSMAPSHRFAVSPSGVMGVMGVMGDTAKVVSPEQAKEETLASRPFGIVEAAFLPAARLEAAIPLPDADGPNESSNQSVEAAPERWDRFWSGSARSAAGGDSVSEDPLVPNPSGLGASPSGKTASQSGVMGVMGDTAKVVSPAQTPVRTAPARPKAKGGELTKGTFWTAAIAAGAAFAARLPLAADYKPLILAGAAFAGTFAVNRVVAWAVTKIGNALGWQPNTTVVVRMAAQIAVWTSGATTGMAIAGASTQAMLTTAGVGGLAITFAVKDVVSNFIEAVRFLVSRPFSLGETIKVGDGVYKVEDMTMHYVILSNAAEPVPGPPAAGVSAAAEAPSHILMAYGNLAGKPITLFREYHGRAPSFVLGLPSVAWGKLKNAAGKGIKDGLGKSAVWTALAVAAIPLLGYAAGIWPILAVALPYLQGGAAVWISKEAGQFLSRLVTRVSDSQGWSPQTTMILRVAARALAWTVGGTAALRMFGVSWAGLLASLGVTSVALGFAAAETMGNLVAAARILLSQPFKIGDRIRVGDFEGVVTDMNMSYVVLRGDEGTSTLIPYSVVKTATLRVFKDYVKAG